MKDLRLTTKQAVFLLPSGAKKNRLLFSAVHSRTIILLAILILALQFSTAQTTGDYRSNAATMNWGTIASWQQYNGSIWVAATDYPGQTACTGCTVTIQNGHAVTLNVAPANSIGNLVVGGGANGSLTLGAFAVAVSGNLTVNTGATLTLATGTLTVAGTSAIGGNVTDASNIGVNTFTGLVTKTGGTWTSTAVTSASNMVFLGGLTNNGGAFNAGAATLADNQTLAGNVNISFTGGLTVLGNSDLNITGTTTAGVSMAGAAGINYTVRNLSITGLLTVSTAGNLTVTGTTNLTGTGAFNDNNNTGITSFAGLVTHNSTGSWSSTTVSTAANMVFASGFVNTAGGFSAGAATIGDNQPLTGTVNMSFNAGIVVLGNSDLNVGGTATTGVTLSGSASNTFRNLSLTGRLTVSTSGNLTVTGATAITGNGAFVDNNNVGITSFAGTVTHNSTGLWSTPIVTTAANMVFSSGFTNIAGAFSAGGATIPAGQTLNGGIVMVFNSPLSITGSGDITISGTGGVRFSGGTAIHYTIPGNLTLNGTLLVNTGGNFTVSGSTSIVGAGDFTDNNNSGISTFTGLVTHNSTGRWVSTSVTNPANMVFLSGFTNTAGTFSAGGATIGDNQVLTGTVNMVFSRGVVVLGNGDITIAGTQATGVTFGGSLINYSVRNLLVMGLLTVSTSGNFTVSGTTDISGAAAFLDNNGTGITTFTGLVTLGSSAQFTSTIVNTVGRMLFGGGIINNNTTPLSFYAGAVRATATQSWSGAGGITTTGVVDVSSGTLTNSMSGPVTIGGTLTGSGTSFVQGSNTYLYLGSTTPLSITTFTTTATGNTVEYKSAGGATIRSQAYHHLVISGTGNKIISAADLTVNGNLTISSGVLSNTTNNRNISIYGNWINNVASGGFTAGTGTVSFVGSSAQTIGGTGNTTFYRLTVNNASGITQTSSSTITNVLSLTAGIISTGASTVIITSTGSISRVSGHINGNQQRNFATGTNVSRTYDIGDASSYAPVTVTFSSVTTAGNVIVKTTGTDHPVLVSSYLNSSLSANRYWTITNSATVFTNYNVVLNFVAGDIDVSLNTSNIIPGRYSGSWSYPVVGTKTATSTQITGLTAFGDLCLAEQLPCTTPALVINDPAPFCSPSTVDLTAPAVTAGSASGLTFTYWRDVSATISLPSPSAVGAADTYYIKGTVALGGCSDVKPVVVTRSNPTGLLSGSATICSGGSASLSIDATGAAPWSGTLSDGTTFSGSSTPLTVSVTPISNTTYSIATLTDAGCTAQAGDKTGIAAISLASLPTTASAGPDQSNCATSTTLAANTPVVGTGSWSIISGSGGAFSSVTNPVATFTGSVGETYVLRWSIANSPCTESSDDVTVAFTSGTWTGAVSSDWNNTGNWCGGILPVGIINLVLPAGLPHYPVIDNTITINGLSVASGATITISVNGSLTIRGDYSNSGTIDNNGSIILNGSSVQLFPGTLATVAGMKNLEVDNDAGVVMDKSFGITGTLSPTAGVISLSDKKITLVSNATGTARVANVGGSFDYSGGGKFVLQRYVPARRAWRLFTSPLTNSNSIYDSWQNGGVYEPGNGTFVTGPGGANGLDADAGASLKQYDLSGQALVPVNSTYVPLSQGISGSADNTGYFIFIRGDRAPANLTPPNQNATVLSSEGELQTGTQTFPASSVAGRFTLIGNPFASPIDFNTVTRNNLVKRFYTWDPSLNTVGGYVTLDDVDNDGVFSNSVSGSVQTNEILSHQAFFVETVANGSAGVSITENDKTDGGTYIVARPRSAGPSSMNINLYLLNADSSRILADGTKAEFDDTYHNGVDVQDALKFPNINETFSFARNGSGLALERKPLLANDTLFIKFSKSTQRNYQMKFVPGNMESVPATAWLKDNFMGTEMPVSLLDTTLYSFSVTSSPGSYNANRFMIVFRPFSTLPLTITNISASASNKGIRINWSSAADNDVANYIVQKSANGSDFSNAHIAVSKMSPVESNYEWFDEKPFAGHNYYRVKIEMKNGAVTFSDVVLALSGKVKQAISIFPNPVQNNTLGLQLSGQSAGEYSIKLFDAEGRQLYSRNFVVAGNNAAYQFSVLNKLAKGNYFVEVTGHPGVRFYKQVSVQ